MIDKMAVHSLKKIGLERFFVRWALATLLSAGMLIQAVNAAEQKWWFDVEVIVFKRNVDAASISEKFKQSQLEQSDHDAFDLITPYLSPDLSYLRAGLPYCRVSKQLAVKAQYEQDFAFPVPIPEINGAPTSYTDKELKQAQRMSQNLTTSSKQVTAADVQYEVATADTFMQPNSTASLTEPNYASASASASDDANSTNPSYSAQNSSTDTGPQPSINLSTEVDLIRPAIIVEFIEWQIPNEFPCAYAEQVDPFFATINAMENNELAAQLLEPVKRVPDVINGIEWQQKRGAFLLPTTTMYMHDLYEKIVKQADITPMLHLNWRQEVKFSRAKGQTFRLFAGENFAQQFDANGSPLIDSTDSLSDKSRQPTDSLYIPEQELARLNSKQQTLSIRTNEKRLKESKEVTEDLFASIATALADATPVDIDEINMSVNKATEQQNATSASIIIKELWQLDGEITVYLRNINRVPYLHIDSNLDFRQPIFDSNKILKMHSPPTSLTEQSAAITNRLQQTDSLQQTNSLQPSLTQPSFQKQNTQEPNFLQSVNFNQLRRVISKQVHYFDHPLFGMVVRLNRYRWPEEDEQEETELSNSPL
jgi:hypothetical protein